MRSFRDDVHDYFAREAARIPTPAGLRSDVLIYAGSRAAQRHAPQWLAAALAAVLALLIIAGLLAAGGLRHLQPGPAKPGPTPAPRAYAGAAYDDSSGQFVLFGGTVGNTQVADTWTWDGKNWTLHQLATRPAARQYPAMAYDPTHRYLVLFGGTTSSGSQTPAALADTWTWDGTSWTQHQSRHTPSPSTNPNLTRAMSYDPISHTVLVYVERVSGNETWAWDGTDWMQLHPATDPGSSQVTLVSDGSRLLLIGMPFGPIGGRYYSQTWAWDGRNWVLLAAAMNLPATTYVAAFDPTHRQIVVLDALNVGANSVSDTWIWTGTTWTRQHPTSGPSVMPYMAYAKALNKIIAWGDQYNGSNADLWVWDGSTWVLLQHGSQHASMNSGGKGYLGTMSPSSAETVIRGTVTTTTPVLLPSWLPTGLEAQVNASSDAFSVRYQSDQRDKSISLGIVVPNPPPCGNNAVQRSVTFRGVSALYEICDSSSPLSSRWLMWNEPGSMAAPLTKSSGMVPYFLSTDGLTEQEFWQLANSLK